MCWREWRDIEKLPDGSGGYVHVQGKEDRRIEWVAKGWAHRKLPVSREFFTILDEYRRSLPHGTRWIVPSKKGRGRLGNPTKLVQKIFQQAGIY
jgi:hypothetical protein